MLLRLPTADTVGVEGAGLCMHAVFFPPSSLQSNHMYRDTLNGSNIEEEHDSRGARESTFNKVRAAEGRQPDVKNHSC